MIWLWILVGLAAFLALLCLMRLQLQADFEETVSLVLRIGPVSLQLLPQKRSLRRSKKKLRKNKVKHRAALWKN